jgi:ribosomal protein L16/L10AE
MLFYCPHSVYRREEREKRGRGGMRGRREKMRARVPELPVLY